MQIDQIIAECLARKRVSPIKTPRQIVNEIMEEINGYKAELSARPEFSLGAEVKPAAPAEATIAP